MGFSMRMGMGLGTGMQKGGGGGPIDWTIAAAADGTKYVLIQCADEGQTITCSPACDIKLVYTDYNSGWVKSVNVPAGATNRYIYFRGNGTGGILTFPKPGNVTYLYLNGTGSSITGSITGMALTYLYLDSTGSSITGSITGMALTYLRLRVASGITGSINGMALTYLYLESPNNDLTGSITGMALSNVVLVNVGTQITGTMAIIGTPAKYIYIVNSYNYPWTEQTFGGTKRTWGEYTMYIGCLADAPTPAEFDEWLLGLASVSNAVTPDTVSLTLKNTPTIAELNAAGYGETDTESGYYAMVTTLGYTLILGE